jgi:hypothetical protein
LTKALYLAPECEAFQATAAADVWCLGATLFEALAQKPYQADEKDAKAEIAGLPLALLLRRCLFKNPEKRATLTEVLAILEKGPSAALDVAEEAEEAEEVEASQAAAAAPDIQEDLPEEPREEHAEEQPVESGAPPEVGEIESGAGWADLLDIPIIKAPLPPKQVTLDVHLDNKPKLEAMPAAPEEPLPIAAAVPIEELHRPMQAKRQPVEARFLPLERSEQDSTLLALTKFVPPAKPPRRGFGIRLKAGPGAWRGIVAGAAAVLMVAGVVWQVIIPRLQTEVESAGPTRGGSSGRPDASAWLTRTLPAGDGTLPDARRKPVPQDAPAEGSGAAVSAVPVWRVVLYSYEHQTDAERRVELVNHNHPGLRAHLFVAGNGGPYVVVTGDATSQEHALALRKRAVQLGVSHAHVQEFAQ